MIKHASSFATSQLRAFVEIVRFGNYRDAADALHITREGLRRRLRVLEDRLNVSLFETDRGRKAGIRLTPEGNMFYSKAVEFLEEAKHLTELFEYEHSSLAIRIAVASDIADYHLSSIVKDFKRQFPHVALHVSAGTDRQIVSEMQSNPRIKVGICASDGATNGLVYRQLLHMSWCVVAQLGHPLLEQPGVTLVQLADEPLIMFQPGCAGRQRILEAFSRSSIKPNIGIEVTTVQMMLNLVEAGMGVGVVPVFRASALLRGRRISRVEIMDFIRPVEVGVLARANVDDIPTRRLIGFILDQFSPERSLHNAVSNRRSDSLPGNAGAEVRPREYGF